MRQEIRGLVQQIDAQLVIGNADMDVQAADRQPPPNTLQIPMQARIAIVLGGLLRVPAGKGMRRRGYRRQTTLRRHPGDCGAQPPQFRVRLAKARTNPGADLDLRAQKLRAHLTGEQRLALLQHLAGRIADDIAGCAVDEKIFLFDAEGELRFSTHFTPRIDRVCERGSRRGQRPLSTWWKNSAQLRLKSSGSSRLTACPVFGKTTSAAVGIVRFINRLGSRHGSSSSPVMINVGTSRARMPSVRSHSEGRRACTPRIVLAEPGVECSARCAANSLQPRGSLFW